MSGGHGQVLWLYGPPCVGKSTTTWELYERLLSGSPRAYFDVDQVGMCFPAPEGDPDRHRLKAHAAGALIRRLLAAGAGTVVVSGVLDQAALDTEVMAAAGVPVVFCRLRLATEDLKPRLEARYNPRDVERALEEAQQWDLWPSSDLVVDTTGASSLEVAGRVLQAVEHIEPDGGLTWEAEASRRPDTGPPDTGRAGRAVLIYGATAVGKSTVAFDLLTSLAQLGVRAAYLDLQQLSFLADLPTGQAPDHVLISGFVAALWQQYRAVGATQLLLSGHIEHPGDLDRYRDALGDTPLVTCRLHADHDSLRERIRARADGRGANLAGDRLKGLPEDEADVVLGQAWLEQTRISRLEVADVVLDTSGDAPAATRRRLQNWLA